MSEKYKNIGPNEFYSLFRSSEMFVSYMAKKKYGEAEYTIDEILEEVKNRIECYGLEKLKPDFVKLAKQEYFFIEKDNEEKHCIWK